MNKAISFKDYINLADLHKIDISYKKPTDTIPLTKFKDTHRGSDIYVICSGSSLNYIDKSFYSGKITVCINHACNFVDDFNYMVVKEIVGDMYSHVLKNNGIMVASEWKFGVPNVYRNSIKIPEITTLFTADQDFEKCVKNENYLFTSNSTVTTGMHFAAYCGAKNIILVGHDCGAIDGKIHVDNYPKAHAETKKDDDYKKWMKKAGIEDQTMKFKKLLIDHYKVNIVSINPFVNMNFEGHQFESF